MLVSDEHRHGHRLAKGSAEAKNDSSDDSTLREWNDRLLDHRYPLGRQLHPEVAAGHHHAVAGGQDLVELLDRLRLLQLGDQRHPGAERFIDELGGMKKFWAKLTPEQRRQLKRLMEE